MRARMAVKVLSAPLGAVFFRLSFADAAGELFERVHGHFARLALFKDAGAAAVMLPIFARAFDRAFGTDKALVHVAVSGGRQLRTPYGPRT